MGVPHVKLLCCVELDDWYWFMLIYDCVHLWSTVLMLYDLPHLKWHQYVITNLQHYFRLFLPWIGSWWPAFSVVWNTFQTATTQVKRATLPFLQVANILGWLCLSCRMSVSFLRNSLPGEKVIKIQVSPHLLFKLFMLKQIPPLAPNTAKNLSFACQTSSWCCLYVPKDCKHAGRIVRVD